MFFKSFGNSGSVERSFGKFKKNKNKNYKKYLIGKTRLKSCCCGYQRQEVGKMDIKGFMSDFGNKSWKYYLKAEHNWEVSWKKETFSNFPKIVLL